MKNGIYCFMIFLILSVCLSCSNSSKDVIKIATKPRAESFILGEMLALIIERDAGYPVEIVKGIGGGTSNIHPAMEKGDFDLYPEYTSTGYVMVLGHSAAGVSDEDIWNELLAGYERRFNMTWISRYGFNNTYCVAVSREKALLYNLKTTSDLAKVADKLVFGANPDYIERADGFNALRGAYGLNFKNVVEVDVGLRWAALMSGNIDVTNGFTTDAELVAFDAVALEDDLRLQVNYFCSTVVRLDTLAKYPRLRSSLEKMDGLISDAEMTLLNYEVSVELKDERDVAFNFLAEKGVIAR